MRTQPTITRKMPVFCIAIMMAGLAVEGQAQESVQDLADMWTSAYNAYDQDTLSALYTEDAQLMINGEPTISGRDNIEAYWAADFEDRKPVTLLSVTHSIDGVDMRLVHGNYHVINRDNGEIIGQGRFAHIWVKTAADEWRLDRDLWAVPFEPYVE